MIAHDDAHFESIALLALGVLPGPLATELATHVAACAACRTEYAELRYAADLVGYQGEIAPDALDEVGAFRLKSRVLKSIRAASVGEPAAVASNGQAVKQSTSPSKRPWISWSVAAAAIVIAAIDTISNTSLRNDNDRLVATMAEQSSVAATNATQARELDRRLAAVVAPGGKRFAIPQGEIVASNGRMIIAMRDLPALPPGKTYQAWTRKRGATVMTPGALFGPDAAGVAFVEVPLAASDVSAVAVSVEPASGSKAPTSKPTFVRSLT